MVKKWCAVTILGLALSPFTAPFRTFDPQRSSPIRITQPELDSVVAPITDAGRLKIGPALGPMVSSLAPAPPAISFLGSAAPTSRINHLAVFSPILRL